MFFTFQSGYIPTEASINARGGANDLYIPIWLYSNNNADFRFLGIADFTFQSGYIPTLLEDVFI